MARLAGMQDLPVFDYDGLIDVLDAWRAD